MAPADVKPRGVFFGLGDGEAGRVGALRQRDKFSGWTWTSTLRARSTSATCWCP